MLVSFSVANFRSIAAEETFSMVASQRFPGEHENHAMPIPGSKEKVLRAAVIYGANGAGKSNLFKALTYLRRLAVVTRKKNAGTRREPFRLGHLEAEPSSFELRFIVGGKLYNFGVKVDDERILEEWLVWIDGNRERPLYERITKGDGTVEIDAKGLKPKSKKLDALATVGGPQNQTFLATIRATLDAADYGDELSAIIDWFDTRLGLIAPTMKHKRLGHLLVEEPAFMEFASAFLRDASTGVQSLDVKKKELTEEELLEVLPTAIAEKVLKEIEDGESVLVQLSADREILIERSDKNHYYMLSIGAEHDHPSGKRVSLKLSEESDGTQRLLNLIPALHRLRTRGGVYVIDEIDRSLHPLLAWQFLDFFLKSCDGDERQIIVTTHESNLLDLDLLRRDEIWFTEKDATGATHIYSLSDFKIRKDLEVRKHYLDGRFGAIPFLGNLDRLLTPSKATKAKKAKAK